mmetsp:Transcript_28453/g.90658  ORF Transcript_28453/g.90658 Transcript_28453/m.90658 type:complete len:207 (-) Transcript_28453:89-709(-)
MPRTPQLHGSWWPQGASLLAPALLCFLARPGLAEVALAPAMPGQGGAAALSWPDSGAASMEDPFGALDDEFDSQRPDSSAMKAGTVALVAAVAGGLRYLSAQAGQVSGPTDSPRACNHKSERPAANALAGPATRAALGESPVVAEFPEGSVEGQPDDSALWEEDDRVLEAFLTRECKAAADREYEDAMDREYSNLLQQLLEGSAGQ